MRRQQLKIEDLVQEVLGFQVEDSPSEEDSQNVETVLYDLMRQQLDIVELYLHGDLPMDVVKQKIMSIKERMAEIMEGQDKDKFWWCF